MLCIDMSDRKVSGTAKAGDIRKYGIFTASIRKDALNQPSEAFWNELGLSKVL